MMLINVIFTFHVGLIVHCAQAYETEEFEIRMPSVHPEKPDTYLHTTRELKDDSVRYIVAFEPIASMDIVHHMMVHGCQYDKELESGLRDCYDVGFKVGKSAGIRYISLEVHYANISTLEDGSGDTSGVKLYLTSAALSKHAAVAIIGTGGYIKGRTTEHFEVACPVTSEAELHPFAFRTHAHERGLLISGYRVRREEDGVEKWSLIGKKNPLLPQYFYPVEDNTMIIKKGDILAARCTMKNNENRTIYIGSTSKDEMCNFYLMFYAEDYHSDVKGCFSSGPPFYYWATDNLLNNIPLDASDP